MTSKQQKTPEFHVQRLFIKDVSFEAPCSPEIFRENWDPKVSLDLGTRVNTLEDHVYEVVLKVSVSVKSGKKVAFLAEAEQAGIFTIKNMDEPQLGHTLGSYCPNVLYPYARELITSLVTRGSFPQLFLAPVNFDALYQEHLSQKASVETEGAAS